MPRIPMRCQLFRSMPPEGRHYGGCSCIRKVRAQGNASQRVVVLKSVVSALIRNRFWIFGERGFRSAVPDWIVSASSCPAWSRQDWQFVLGQSCLGKCVIRRAALGGIGLLLAFYAGVLGYMYANQTRLIFDTSDSGGLAAPAALAIPGGIRLTIATADGERLAGWYLAPVSPDAPVFLFLHGKGGGLHRKIWRWQRIQRHGAGVLAISYRGFVGSTGSPSETGLYEDARAAYQWLRARHQPEQIVLHGLSLGTGVAARLATEVQARAVILEAPYTAISDVAAERYPYLPVHALIAHPFRTRDIIHELKMPVMIAHGDRDSVIPVEHGKALFSLAREPKRLEIFKGGDHSTLVRDGLYARIWPYLNGLKRSGP